MDDEMKREFQQIRQAFGGIAGRLNALDDHAKTVDRRLGLIEDHAKSVDRRLDKLTKRVDDGFSRVDRRFEQIDRRFDDAGRRFDELLAEIKVIGGAFAHHSDRLDDLEKRVIRLELRRA